MKNKRRKITIIVSAVLGMILAGFVILVVFHPFDSLIPGDASHVEIRQVSSELYSQGEIDDAVEVIRREFSDWNGCRLKILYYAGDDSCAYETKVRGSAAMVLKSDFTTGNLDGNGGLNSNATYSNWSWILIKDDQGNWKHIDHGYG